MPYSKYSGTLQGGSLFHEGPGAPVVHVATYRDGGTGNFDTPSVRKIIGASTGGELHDQFKDYTLQEWFYEKAVRAKDIEDRKSSKQNVNRTRLVDATKDLFKSGASEVAGQVAAIPEHIGSLLGGVSNIIDEIAAAGQKKSVLNEDQLQTLRLSRRYATQGVEALMEGENALELARKKQQDAKVVQQKINKMSLKKERSEQDEARSRHSKMPSSLTVHIHGAKNLPKMDSFLGKVDPFVEVSVIDGPGSKSIPQRNRTSVLYSNFNPEWNESFDFAIQANLRGEKRPEIVIVDVYEFETKKSEKSIFDKAGAADNILIGRVFIPLSSFVRATKEKCLFNLEDLKKGAESERVIYKGSLTRSFDLRNADNGEVIFGYGYDGSPSSIRVSLVFTDGSLSEKDKLPTQIPMEMPDKAFLEPKARPPPTWKDHPVVLEQLKAKLKDQMAQKSAPPLRNFFVRNSSEQGSIYVTLLRVGMTNFSFELANAGLSEVETLFREKELNSMLDLLTRFPPPATEKDRDDIYVLGLEKPSLLRRIRDFRLRAIQLITKSSPSYRELDIKERMGATYIFSPSSTLQDILDKIPDSCALKMPERLKANKESQAPPFIGKDAEAGARALTLEQCGIEHGDIISFYQELNRGSRTCQVTLIRRS